MAFSLGIKLDAIRQGLRTFDSTFFQAPGRMNVFNEHPFKVLFDYGHNAHAVGALAELASKLDCTGRRIVVLAGPGDRRDEDLREIAAAVAGRFDHYICRRDDDLRSRAPDEVPRIQSAALQAFGVPASAISVIPDEQEAIDAALQMAQSGDLLLVFADALTRSWKQIIKFRSTAPALTGEVASAAAGIGGFIAPAPPAPAAEVARKSGEGRHVSVEGRVPPPRLVASHVTAAPEPDPAVPLFAGEGSKELRGLIRDERGVRLAPETED
jgi:cyanophycin synthetase